MNPNFKNVLKPILALASIMSFRMLGLFMILPVFALYAEKLKGSTPFLMGIALGIYGLFQALLQIPFGMLSDKIGRKPVITLGLLIFIVGSVIAALSTSIEGIILGRALQGAGAIGSAVIAFVADFTDEQHRTKAMAIIGMTIGFSFAIAMVLGAFLNTWIHVSGIFWLTAILGVFGIILLYLAVPKKDKVSFHQEIESTPTLLFSVLRHPKLLPLNFGIFCLHAILMANFIVIPFFLNQIFGSSQHHQWYLYFGVLILSLLLLIPLIFLAERRKYLRGIFLTTIVTLSFVQLLFWIFHHSLAGITLCLLIFFTAFNLLEACLPSLVSKNAPKDRRGTAMGIYSSSQFLGIFFGGSVGGWILQYHGITGILAFCFLLAGVWFVVAMLSGEN